LSRPRLPAAVRREVEVPFKAILKDFVASVPGASGAILADWEGEAVEQYCHFDEFEMKVIGAHKGIILSRVRELHQRVPVGEVEQLMITTEGQRHLVAAVGPEYVLVMVMERSAVPALAMREMGRVVAMLVKEIY
jgi:predicted regulator of Ras-like GTPase activity (Roadblock/LC7/MglB family)